MRYISLLVLLAGCRYTNFEGITGASRASILEPTILAFGNSLTTAVMANTQMDKDAYSNSWSKYPILYLLRNWYNNPNLSWVTGTDIRSVSQALGIESFNYAINGAESSDLEAQYNVAQRYHSKDEYALVTIDIGGNDACRGVSISEFSKNLFDFLSKLKLETAWRVVLVDVYPVHHMRKYNDYSGFLGLNCRVIRRITNLGCPRLNDEMSEKKASAEYKKYNDALLGIAAHLGVEVIEVFKGLEFKPSEMSGDCFHPSVEGHKTVANRFLNKLK